jgi:hypothetical protein
VIVAEPIPAARQPRVVTTVRLSEAAWRWLRKQAEDAAERDGGRPNGSAVLERLIRKAAGER